MKRVGSTRWRMDEAMCTISKPSQEAECPVSRQGVAVILMQKSVEQTKATSKEGSPVEMN